MDVNNTQNTEPQAEPAAQEPQQTGERMFTQAEVDEIIGKRLAKERAKHEQEVATKVSEAERLAKLTGDEKVKEEIKIAQEELDRTRKEFAAMKAEFDQQQMLAQVTKELNARNLPIGMADKMIGKDAETTKANIDAFETTWKQSLEAAIKNEIKGNASSPRLELHENEGQTKDPKDMSFTEFMDYYQKKHQ
mgnify:FL=1